jgi:hypothetical protein
VVATLRIRHPFGGGVAHDWSKDFTLSDHQEVGMGVVYKAQDTKFQNCPRTFLVSGCDFENPDAVRRDLIGETSL